MRDRSNIPDSNFIIRLATLADVEALVELHWMSFKPEDHVPVMLGRRYVRATYHWLVTGAISYVLVAEANGCIVGLIAVADRSFISPMFRACLSEFALSIARHPGLLLRGKLWQRLLRRPDVTSQGRHIADYPGMAQMTNGAVDAGYRGQGVFPALVEASRTFSKERGSRAIRAGIYKTNMPSRRVFIKAGWIETPALETPDTVFYVSYLDPAFPIELGLDGAQFHT
ncbi:MAG: GNAT family N-acetyltransferase [Chloroflexi bacterium]|nr:GNAT family N-acetyltransferase [Chloroflexota bacterium]